MEAPRLSLDDALAIPSKRLGDYGVALSDDSDPEAREWRFFVDGPVMLMSSATGVDGRGFRYLAGVWPERERFIAASLVKLYATGGREGALGLFEPATDIATVLHAINESLLMLTESPRFATGFQPPGCEPLDEASVLAALDRGEPVPGPGWDELDQAALRGYGGTPPERWAAPGEPCVMRYRPKPWER